MSGPIVCFVCFSVVGFCIFMLYRTWAVWCFASSLADRVCELTQQDLAAGHGTTFWRWKALQSVSFDEMANRFWIPLRSDAWWDDTSFLEPIDAEKEKP